MFSLKGKKRTEIFTLSWLSEEAIIMLLQHKHWKVILSSIVRNFFHFSSLYLSLSFLFVSFSFNLPWNVRMELRSFSFAVWCCVDAVSIIVTCHHTNLHHHHRIRNATTSTPNNKRYTIFRTKATGSAKSSNIHLIIMLIGTLSIIQQQFLSSFHNR